MSSCHDPEYQRWMVEEYRSEQRNAAMFDRRPLHPITSPNDPDFDPDDDDEEENEAI